MNRFSFDERQNIYLLSALGRHDMIYQLGDASGILFCGTGLGLSLVERPMCSATTNNLTVNKDGNGTSVTVLI